MQIHKSLDALPVFERTVLTIGAFDGVHLGHRMILDKVSELARDCGGARVVLTFEPHPRTLLRPGDDGFRLLTSTAEKLELLADAGVDHVVLVPFSAVFAQQPPEDYVDLFLVRHFHPCHIVIGYDHRFGRDRSGDIGFLRARAPKHGYEVLEIQARKSGDVAISSTKIRRAIASADISLANRLLGRPYAIIGTVHRGRGIGRTLGFPTANLAVDEPLKLIPPPGIYAARAHGSFGVREAMLYIGDRPTIADTDSKMTIEVNLIDFEGDLYGQTLRVEVIDYIRADRKLDGLEALTAQIQRDKTAIAQRLRQTGSVSLPADQRPAVVILNYNTRGHLEQFLPSVVQHSPGARIVVADNGSPDDSVEWLRREHPGVEVLELGANSGFAQGYNEALHRVMAPIYVVLNSDVAVTPGWMDPILRAMAADPTIAVAQPKILTWSEPSRFEHAGAAGGWIDRLGYPFCRGRIFTHLERDSGQYDVPQRCFWAAGAAFFIRADLYHAFGGFDGRYFAHNEEIDLCWRLQRAGYSIWCIPQSVVYHLGGGTLDYNHPKKVFLNFRNSLFSLLKNERALKLLWLIPARLVLDGIAALRFLFKGQLRSIWSILTAHGSFYAHLGYLLRQRRAAAGVVARSRIGSGHLSGVYPGSIVWAYYARGIKRFSDLGAGVGTPE
jgi:riboflavin kinase/FMN adenylyltransferase